MIQEQGLRAISDAKKYLLSLGFILTVVPVKQPDNMNTIERFIDRANYDY